jgi:hypothetical protein
VTQFCEGEARGSKTLPGESSLSWGIQCGLPPKWWIKFPRRPDEKTPVTRTTCDDHAMQAIVDLVLLRPLATVEVERLKDE